MAKRTTTLNFSLPKSMQAYIRSRVKSGGFGNTSEYLRHVIRQEQERMTGREHADREKGLPSIIDPAFWDTLTPRARAAEQKRLERLLQEGLESGPAVPVTPAYWASFRKRAAERAAQRSRLRRSA